MPSAVTMYKGKSIAVVVPAYNESGFVGEVVETVPAFVDRVYPVDDASTDGTWREIQESAARVNVDAEPEAAFDRKVVPLRHDQNRGVGGAIKTGYLRAREDGIDVTAVMGGDGQMDPDRLPDIVDPVVEGRADYAKGNRLTSPEFHADMPRHRYVGNLMLTWLTKIASGYGGIGDPQNGYTAISLKALEEVPVENMYEFYGYCNDLLVKLNVAGMRVADVPAPITYGEEESHIDYGSYIPKVSLMLLRNFLWRLGKQSRSREGVVPAALYALGATLAVLGMLTLVGLGVTRGGIGQNADDARTVVLGVPAGAILFVAALFVDFASATDRCVRA